MHIMKKILPLDAQPGTLYWKGTGKKKVTLIMRYR